MQRACHASGSPGIGKALLSRWGPDELNLTNQEEAAQAREAGLGVSKMGHWLQLGCADCRLRTGRWSGPWTGSALPSGNASRPTRMRWQRYRRPSKSPAELLARHARTHKPLSKPLLACGTRSPYPLVSIEIQLGILEPELY